MIPSPWAFALLALAAYRLTRLIGWDTFPPVVRVRDRLLGGYVAAWVQQPGAPESELKPLIAYRAEWLHDLLSCPFCLGAWVSLVAYLSWWASPHVTLIAAVPFALSAAVGLVARNLDA